MAQIPQAPEPIAIVGIGCRLPGGSNSARAFWELLRDGRDAITEIPKERWDLGQHFNADPQTPLHQHVRHGGFIDGLTSLILPSLAFRRGKRSAWIHSSGC